MLGKSRNFALWECCVIVTASLYFNLRYISASSQGEYPDPDHEYGPPNSCDRFHELSKLDAPGLTIVSVTHPLDQPMIAAIISTQLEQEALWYTYNIENDQYEVNTIANCTIFNGVFVDFKEIIRNDQYFLGVSTSSTNGLLVEGNTEIQPAETDFILTENQVGPALGTVVVLDEAGNRFVSRQLLFAEDFGKIVTFALTTASGSIQNCFLFSILDKNNFRCIVYCFHPLDFDGEDDNVTHFFQEIPINVSPKLTSIELGTKTLVLITNKVNNYDDVYNYDNSTYTTTSTDYSNVVDVWAHEQGDDPLFLEDEITFETNIITIDSILTKDNVALLAVGTASTSEDGADSVSIYRYDEESYKFVLSQLLEEKSLTEVRFQRILETDEILFFTLSNESENNIHIYPVGSDYSLEESCSLTAEGAVHLEPSSFFYQEQYKAHVIAVTPDGATVFET